MCLWFSLKKEKKKEGSKTPETNEVRSLNSIQGCVSTACLRFPRWERKCHVLFFFSSSRNASKRVSGMMENWEFRERVVMLWWIHSLLGGVVSGISVLREVRGKKVIVWRDSICAEKQERDR